MRVKSVVDVYRLAFMKNLTLLLAEVCLLNSFSLIALIQACSTMCSTCDGPTIDDCKSCVRSSVLRISDYSTHVGTCVCPPSSYMISNGYCGSIYIIWWYSCKVI